MKFFVGLGALVASASAIDLMKDGFDFKGLNLTNTVEPGFKLDLDPKKFDFGSLFDKKEKKNKLPDCLSELVQAGDVALKSWCLSESGDNAPDFQTEKISDCGTNWPNPSSVYDDGVTIRAFVKLQSDSETKTAVLNNPRIFVGITPYRNEDIEDQQDTEDDLKDFYEWERRISAFSTAAMGPDADKWKCEILPGGQTLTCEAKGQVTLPENPDGGAYGLQVQIVRNAGEDSCDSDFTLSAQAFTACGRQWDETYSYSCE